MKYIMGHSINHFSRNDIVELLTIVTSNVYFSTYLDLILSIHFVYPIATLVMLISFFLSFVMLLFTLFSISMLLRFLFILCS